MNRDRQTFDPALFGLLCASPAFAEDVKPEDIATKMGGVVDSLGNADRPAVQGEQKAIIHDLDELIARLEKQCRVPGRHQAEQTRCGAWTTRGSAGEPEESATSSTPTTAARDGASLGTRTRSHPPVHDQGFPRVSHRPERYYRRLAEEKSAKGGDGAKAKGAAGTTKP